MKYKIKNFKKRDEILKELTTKESIWVSNINHRVGRLSIYLSNVNLVILVSISGALVLKQNRVDSLFSVKSRILNSVKLIETNVKNLYERIYQVSRKLK